MSARRDGVLRSEHELLGARFADGGETGPAAVERYANESPDGADTLLADLTGATYLLLSGTGAASLASAALAGRPLSVGECAFEAVLAGDGALVSVPLALRSGDDEIVLLDPSRRGPVLSGWLGFLCGSVAEKNPALAGARLDDAADMLVCLALFGPGAARVLSDYVCDPSELPAPGQVRQVALDAIGCMVARPLLPADAAYLLFVPPAAARRLWRSVLSFTEVEPVGHAELRARLAGLPWGGLLAGTDAVRAEAGPLAEQGLVRAGDDFVGARALGRGAATPSDERSER